MILQVSGLSKVFRQGNANITALANVGFNLEEGKSLAIVGPSGSVKTTLLSLLAGLEPVEQGDIILSGKSLKTMNESALTNFRAKNLGIVFQQFYLMPHLSALENVCLPLEILGEKDVEKKAELFLQQVGLGDRIHHLPGQLSGGECQRVAIARASVASPPLLLADEPSGNLDTATGEKVMEILFQLVKNKNMSLVLVTHDVGLAQKCDSQIHLVGGSIQ